MLAKTRKEIKLTNESKNNEIVVESYSATINTNNLQNVQVTNYIIDQAIYKENRVECRKDRAAFEDEVYALQDKMISEQNTPEVAK